MTPLRFDAVLFDAAETLFTTRGSVGQIYGSVARRYGSQARDEDIQMAFVRQFRHSGPLRTDDEKGWWRDVVYRVFTDVGMIPDFDGFFEDVYDKFRDSRGWVLFPETETVLEDLRRLGVRLGVISNFDSRVYSVLRSLRILHFFSAVTISSEVGAAKPDPEIFLAAIRAAGAKPDRILYIGDSLADDVLAGRNAGLQTVLLDRGGRHGTRTDVMKISSLNEIHTLLN